MLSQFFLLLVSDKSLARGLEKRRFSSREADRFAVLVREVKQKHLAQLQMRRLTLMLIFSSGFLAPVITNLPCSTGPVQEPHEALHATRSGPDQMPS